MKVFAINGISYSGKDTFVDMVTKLDPMVSSYSTIDPVKGLYTGMGWDGIKTDRDRKALNVLKRLWIDLNDGPLMYVTKAIQSDWREGVFIAFVMVREFEEMQKVVAWSKRAYGFGQTIEIVRDGLELPPVEREFLLSHPYGYQYNWRVYNKSGDSKTMLPLAEEFVTQVKYGTEKEYNVLGTKFDMSEYSEARTFEKDLVGTGEEIFYHPV